MMITLPPRAINAINDYAFVSTLLKRAMNSARINCTHEMPDDCEKMIHHIRRAEKSTGLSCKVFMDLAGPKVQTSTVQKPHAKSKKGEFILSAMEILDHVLVRMEQHQRKKTPQLRAPFTLGSRFMNPEAALVETPDVDEPDVDEIFFQAFLYFSRLF